MDVCPGRFSATPSICRNTQPFHSPFIQPHGNTNSQFQFTSPRLEIPIGPEPLTADGKESSSQVSRGMSRYYKTYLSRDPIAILTFYLFKRSNFISVRDVYKRAEKYK